MVMWVPGFVAVGIWFVFQVISGLGILGGIETDVAYGAHIGGFVIGAVLAKLFGIRQTGDRGETPDGHRHIDGQI